MPKKFKGLTLQEYVNFLQAQIDTGAIDGSLPAAVCSVATPEKNYWLLDAESTTVVRYDDVAIVTY